jgi:hypothetical protein
VGDEDFVVYNVRLPEPWMHSVLAEKLVLVEGREKRDGQEQLAKRFSDAKIICGCTR